MSQVRRLMRRLENQAAVGGALQRAHLGRVLGPAGTEPGLSREDLQDMQDERRNRLAERLLEIGLEETTFGQFCDTYDTVKGEGEKGYDQDVPKHTVEEWYLKHAGAALAAAEVIYPEVPNPEGAQRRHDLGLPVDPPPAARDGMLSVAGDAPSFDPRRLGQEG